MDRHDAKAVQSIIRGPEGKVETNNKTNKYDKMLGFMV